MRLLAILLALLLAACEAVPPPVSGCVAEGELVPVCGFSRPEDIELLPDGRTLLISEMGTMDGSEPGSLALYDTRDGVITRLPQFTTAGELLWGETACTEPPGSVFSPHGIDLARRSDGALQLLAVNHGGRESVELFVVHEERGSYSLEWRGCVVPPAGTHINDVAALPDGGFVISNMFPRDGLHIGPFSLHLLMGMLGFDTGNVLRCQRSGCTPLPGTEAPFPNGVQVDAAGQALFLNAYLAGEVRKIALADGRRLGTVKISSPDNSQWDARGRLLVASHTGGPRQAMSCFGIIVGACGAAFAIVALDPATLVAETVLAHQGPPMGAATVAQQVGDVLYLGSYAGDRLLRVPMP
jgi:sugar lactone lactonase YvrE